MGPSTRFKRPQRPVGQCLRSPPCRSTLRVLALCCLGAVACMGFPPGRPARRTVKEDALGIKETDEFRTAEAVHLLRTCTTLACLREVHALSSPQSPFNFPHFYVIGWRKCATTSLFRYLRLQDKVQGSFTKEPHFFTGLCRLNPWRCPAKLNNEAYYVQTVLRAVNASAVSLQRATFEASADYSEEGAHAAHAVRVALPWVRIVASLREPISRAISWENGLASYAHTKRVACLAEEGAELFGCLERHFRGGQNNYSYPLSHWLAEFPREQLFIMQYENLTGSAEAEVLRDLHAFIGLDPPPKHARLARLNIRKKKQLGWGLTRQQYQQLIDWVRPDAHRVAAMLAEHGLGGGPAWLTTWEDVWRENLEDNCNDADQCQIHVT